MARPVRAGRVGSLRVTAGREHDHIVAHLARQDLSGTAEVQRVGKRDWFIMPVWALRLNPFMAMRIARQ